MSAAALRRRKGPPLVEGEFDFRQEDFDVIAALLREQSGISLQESKAALVYSRLAKRLRKIGCPDFAEYCAIITSPNGAEERVAMLTALTTNFTSFFREPHHFQHFREKVAPALIKTARDGGRVRLWSAASSTGEEPYSLALTLLDVFPEAARYDLRILATDIDHKCVATARAGLYKEETVAPIRPALRDRWMTRDGEMWAVKDEVKRLMTFNELNLLGSWPMRGRFDVIFCRNVVIYFDDETQAKVWSRFKNVLAPTGRLYIGHSERIDIGGFESDGMTIYRLARGGRA
jgi:chemotaxis protein methyltransferase CheR